MPEVQRKPHQEQPREDSLKPIKIDQPSEQEDDDVLEKKVIPQHFNEVESHQEFLDLEEAQKAFNLGRKRGSLSESPKKPKKIDSLKIESLKPKRIDENPQEEEQVVMMSNRYQ